MYPYQYQQPPPGGGGYQFYQQLPWSQQPPPPPQFYHQPPPVHTPPPGPPIYQQQQPQVNTAGYVPGAAPYVPSTTPPMAPVYTGQPIIKPTPLVNQTHFPATPIGTHQSGLQHFPQQPISSGVGTGMQQSYSTYSPITSNPGAVPQPMYTGMTGIPNPTSTGVQPYSQCVVPPPLVQNIMTRPVAPTMMAQPMAPNMMTQPMAAASFAGAGPVHVQPQGTGSVPTLQPQQTTVMMKSEVSHYTKCTTVMTSQNLGTENAPKPDSPASKSSAMNVDAPEFTLLSAPVNPNLIQIHLSDTSATCSGNTGTSQIGSKESTAKSIAVTTSSVSAGTTKSKTMTSGVTSYTCTHKTSNSKEISSSFSFGEGADVKKREGSCLAQEETSKATRTKEANDNTAQQTKTLNVTSSTSFFESLSEFSAGKKVKDSMSAKPAEDSKKAENRDVDSDNASLKLLKDNTSVLSVINNTAPFFTKTARQINFNPSSNFPLRPRGRGTRFRRSESPPKPPDQVLSDLLDKDIGAALEKELDAYDMYEKSVAASVRGSSSSPASFRSAVTTPSVSPSSSPVSLRSSNSFLSAGGASQLKAKKRPASWVGRGAALKKDNESPLITKQEFSAAVAETQSVEDSESYDYEYDDYGSGDAGRNMYLNHQSQYFGGPNTESQKLASFDYELQESLFRKFTSYIRRQGMVSVKSRTIIDIFKRLSSHEREFIRNQGTIQQFLRRCPYLGCYGYNFFVLQNQDTTPNFQQEEPPLEFNDAFPGYSGGYGGADYISSDEDECAESVEDSTFYCEEVVNEPKTPVETKGDENNFSKFIESFKALNVLSEKKEAKEDHTPKKRKKSQDSFDTFIEKLDECGIQVGNQDEVEEEEEEEVIRPSSSCGPYEKFLKSLHNAGYKVEYPVTSSASREGTYDLGPVNVSSTWSEGNDAGLNQEPGFKVEEAPEKEDGVEDKKLKDQAGQESELETDVEHDGDDVIVEEDVTVEAFLAEAPAMKKALKLNVNSPEFVPSQVPHEPSPSPPFIKSHPKDVSNGSSQKAQTIDVFEKSADKPGSLLSLNVKTTVLLPSVSAQVMFATHPSSATSLNINSPEFVPSQGSRKSSPSSTGSVERELTPRLTTPSPVPKDQPAVRKSNQIALENFEKKRTPFLVGKLLEEERAVSCQSDWSAVKNTTWRSASPTEEKHLSRSRKSSTSSIGSSIIEKEAIRLTSQSPRPEKTVVKVDVFCQTEALPEPKPAAVPKSVLMVSSKCQTICIETKDASTKTSKIKTVDRGYQILPDVRSVMINTLDLEELAPPPETADAFTATDVVVTKDRATLTRIENEKISRSTNTKIQMVPSTLYGKALSRALMAEERILDLQAGKCVADLTRMKCDASLTHQQEQTMLCPSQKEKESMEARHQKVKDGLDREIAKVQNMLVENLQRLRDGELLASLPPIEIDEKSVTAIMDQMALVKLEIQPKKTAEEKTAPQIEQEKIPTLKEIKSEPGEEIAIAVKTEPIDHTPPPENLAKPTETAASSQPKDLERKKPTLSRPPGLSHVPDPLPEDELKKMEQLEKEKLERLEKEKMKMLPVPALPPPVPMPSSLLPAPPSTQPCSALALPSQAVDPMVLQQLITMQLCQQYPYLSSNPHLLQPLVFRQLGEIMQLQRNQVGGDTSPMNPRSYPPSPGPVSSQYAGSQPVNAPGASVGVSSQPTTSTHSTDNYQHKCPTGDPNVGKPDTTLTSYPSSNSMSAACSTSDQSSQTVRKGTSTAAKIRAKSEPPADFISNEKPDTKFASQTGSASSSSTSLASNSSRMRGRGIKPKKKSSSVGSYNSDNSDTGSLGRATPPPRHFGRGTPPLNSGTEDVMLSHRKRKEAEESAAPKTSRPKHTRVVSASSLPEPSAKRDLHVPPLYESTEDWDHDASQYVIPNFHPTPDTYIPKSVPVCDELKLSTSMINPEPKPSRTGVRTKKVRNVSRSGRKTPDKLTADDKGAWGDSSSQDWRTPEGKTSSDSKRDNPPVSKPVAFKPPEDVVAKLSSADSSKKTWVDLFTPKYVTQALSSTSTRAGLDHVSPISPEGKSGQLPKDEKNGNFMSVSDPFTEKFKKTSPEGKGEDGLIQTVSPDKESEEEWQQVTKKNKQGRKMTDPKPKKSATNAGGKPNNFERLIMTLQKAKPDLDRNAVINLIKQVRSNHNGLQGLTLHDIINEAVEMSKKPCNAQAKNYADAIQIKSGQHSRHANDASGFMSLGKIPSRGKEKSISPVPTSTPSGGASRIAPAIGMKAFTSGHDEDCAECAICFDPLAMFLTKSLDCGHAYHDHCIREWVLKVERTCPMCRSHALFHEEFPKLG